MIMPIIFRCCYFYRDTDRCVITDIGDGRHAKNAEFEQPDPHVPSWACAVPVAGSVAEASNVHEVGRAPPLPYRRTVRDERVPL